MTPHQTGEGPSDEPDAGIDLEAPSPLDGAVSVASGFAAPKPPAAAGGATADLSPEEEPQAAVTPSARSDDGELGQGDGRDTAIGALRHLLVLLAALVVWLWALAQVDETQLGDLGLMGVLPVAGFAAIAALIIGFTIAITQDPTGRIPGVYVSAIAVAIHGMPTFAYEHLRFSWAWKHVGIVEFIQRTGAVDPGIDTLAVYHSWPGFFGVNAWITTSSQLDTALSYAAWAPIVFNLLFVAALYVLLKALTSDPRLIWTALLFFVLSNWVGQDYFAPQALAYFFYLAVLAMLLRWFGTAPNQERLEGRGAAHRVLVVTVTLGLLAISMTHQLTPVMALIAIGGLVALSTIHVRWPLYAAALFLIAWILGPARDFVLDNATTVLRDVGGFQANLEAGISDLEGVDSGQTTVAFVARSMTAGVIALAALGWASRRMLRLPTAVAVFLAVVPIALILFSSYGDEVVFRAYLFALPFLAWLAASVWFPSERTGTPLAASITLGIVAVTMAAATTVATFGSDVRHVFSDSEVAASEFVYANSAPESLLVDLNRDYPGQFRNYENFTYITIDRTSEDTQMRVVSDPVGVLERWLADERFSESFVLITDTMRSSIERLGTLPPESVETIEAALRGSDRFDVVFESGQSVVFTLRGDR